MRCSPRMLGASFAALLHTRAQLPGVEPHATLVASPGSCCASTSSDLRSERLTSSCNQVRKIPCNCCPHVSMAFWRYHFLGFHCLLCFPPFLLVTLTLANIDGAGR